MNERYELLKKLCTCSGISGDEKNVRDIIISEIKDYADSIKTDNLGNLIVFKKGLKTPAKKLMISAHMDEVGFMVTYITENGFIKFDQVGGIDRRVVFGKRVTLGENHIDGVVGVKPIHLCSDEERETIPKYSDMYIDIGAESREEAEKYVNIGDSVCFYSPFEINENAEDMGTTLKAKAIDDRAGCFIMIELIKSTLEYDCTFTFVVQEEVGLRGAKAAAYTVDPDFAIVLESTTASDIHGCEDSKAVCHVGKGVVVSFMDRSTIYDREMFKEAFYAARDIGVEAQVKSAVAGGNDSGAIHTSRGGVRTLALSLPCRYIHSGLSLVSLRDMEASLKLTKELISRFLGGAITHD